MELLLTATTHFLKHELSNSMKLDEQCIVYCLPTYQLHLSIDILLELFYQLVLPNLFCGSEICGFEVLHDRETFHMK